MIERDPLQQTAPTLALNFREVAALHQAYMPSLAGGGIFIPTKREYQIGEQVFMLLSLMYDPNRIAVQCKVVSITPGSWQGRRQTQGIGVQRLLDQTKNRPREGP